MVKTPAIYRLSPIFHFWHFWHFWCDFCNFCVFFFHFFVFCGCIFFAFFMCLVMKIFGVHFSSIFCGYYFIFCVHFLHFLLPPIVKVDIRYRDNIGYPRYGESYNIGGNQYS
jgi:hypothetical protein